MNDHIFSELIKSLIKDNPDISWELKRQLYWAMDDSYALIAWSTHDFEQRAAEIEDHMGDNVVHYDRSKFKEALNDMLSDHDANWGINWDTIDHWLESCCRLEEPCK